MKNVPEIPVNKIAIMDVDFVKHRFEDGHVGVVTNTRFRVGIRHVQVVYMAACAAVFGVMRGGTGVSLLALTDPLRRNDTYIQVYDWSSHIQGSVCSSFLFGLAMTMIPAELLQRKLGGKITLACSLFVNGALYVALPTIINKGGWMALCNAQFIMGMMQACLVPANQALMHSWVPPIERIWLGPFVFGAVQLGIIISFPFCASVASYPLGWELVFYSLGMMTLSMAVVWLVLTASSPSDHPAIGDKEKEVIEEAMRCYKKKLLPTPWFQILKSASFWGLTCAHVGTNVVFVFFLFVIPVYLVSGLGLELSQSCWYMILPFASMWFVYVTVVPSLEKLYKIGFVSYMTTVTQFRKIINTLGALCTVLGLCLLAYFGATISTAEQVLILSGTLGSIGFQFAGFLENHRDNTENYAGFLVTMSSCIANAVGAAVPLVCGFILNENMGNMGRWRFIFMGVATVATICNLLYLALGSGDRQCWDTVGTKRATKFGYYNDVHQLELDEMKGQSVNRMPTGP